MNLLSGECLPRMPATTTCNYSDFRVACNFAQTPREDFIAPPRIVHPSSPFPFFPRSVCEKNLFDRPRLYSLREETGEKARNYRQILVEKDMELSRGGKQSKEETIGSVSNLPAFAASRSIERGNRTDAMLHVVERLLEIGTAMEEKPRSSPTLLSETELARWNFRSAIKVGSRFPFFFLSFSLSIDCRERDRRWKRRRGRVEQTFVNFDDNRRWRRLEQFRLIPPFNRAIDLATNSNVHESFAMEPDASSMDPRFRIFAPFYVR